MQVGHDSAPGVAEALTHRLAAAGERASKAGAEGGPGQGDEPSGPGVSESAKSISPPTPPLSPSSLGATIEAQATASEEGSAPADRGRSAETPAARARVLIESDPSLSDRPFGQIVSAIARGIEITSGQGEGATTELQAAAPGETMDEAPDPTAGGAPATEEDEEAAAGEKDAAQGEGTAPAEPEPEGALVPEVSASVSETLEEALLDLLKEGEEPAG